MFKIITINTKNIADYPQVICFINPKNEHHGLKIAWLNKRFKEGLIIKILQCSEDKKIVGFIEYIPGEFAWRAVKAQRYLFIHCLWVYPNKNKHKGLGSALVDEVLKDAQKNKNAGVAVITSNGAFMAKKELFIKKGFSLVEEKYGFQLLVRQLGRSVVLPSFVKPQAELEKYKGWHIIYSKQCPWVARFIDEIRPILEKEKLFIAIHEITTAQKAQASPSIYAIFSLVKDGKLLADRYISKARFLNIIKKERKTRPLRES